MMGASCARPLWSPENGVFFEYSRSLFKEFGDESATALLCESAATIGADRPATARTHKAQAMLLARAYDLHHRRLARDFPGAMRVAMASGDAAEVKNRSHANIFAVARALGSAPQWPTGCVDPAVVERWARPLNWEYGSSPKSSAGVGGIFGARAMFGALPRIRPTCPSTVRSVS